MSSKGRRGGARKKSIYLIREVLSDISEEESYGHAPSSDDEASSVESSSDDEYEESDWFICGNRTEPDVVSNEIGTIDTSPIKRTIHGLMWENGAEVPNEPIRKMKQTKTTIKKDYQHLFSTPIDAMFATLPFVFWEITAVEINRYATQFMELKNTKLVVGYKWRPVTVTEVITFFDILIYSMLYPQTGHRVRNAWEDQTVNSWTCHMSQG